MSTIKSSSANLTLNADGSGNDIKFQSNAVEKASIDQDGNVAASGTITANGQAQLSNNNLIGGNTGATSTWIAKRTSSGDGVQIQTTNASGVDTQRLAITCNADSADFTIKDSDIVFGTAGKGICLGVTSNTDANTLDDYEEGTWTPVLGDSAGNNTWSGGAIGTYVKTGKAIMITFHHFTTGSNSSTSAAYITGLPFTSTATYYKLHCGGRGCGGPTGGTWGTNLYLAASVTYLQIQEEDTNAGGASGTNNIQLNEIKTDGSVSSTFWYYAS